MTQHDAEDVHIEALGFEDALIGIGRQFNADVAVYDYHKCLQILMERDGMDPHDAVEFFEFNVVGAYVGPSTPVFMIEKGDVR